MLKYLILLWSSLIIVGSQCDSRSRKLVVNQWEGNISSNSGSSREYARDEECEWLIKAPTGGKFIELIFNMYETECMYDYLTVYDHVNEETRQRLASISGNERVENIISTTGYMYIHLLSDADKVLKGFAATFIVSKCPNNCSGNHGKCIEVTNTCVCNSQWYGERCDEPAITCGAHGTTDTELNKCSCDAGYFGMYCNMEDAAPVHTTRTPSRQYNTWYRVLKSRSRNSIVNWNQDKDMLPRQGHTADIVGDYLYVLGGYDLNEVMYSFKRYHMLSGSWEDVKINSSCKTIPKGRYMHKSIVYKDNIIYCGGYLASTTQLTRECWKFDTHTSFWYKFNTLVYPVIGHTLTLSQHTVYLFGGMTGSNSDDFSCKLYSISLLNPGPGWELISPKIGKCSQIRRSGHTTIYDSVSRNLVVVGGFTPGNYMHQYRSNDVLLYNTDNQIWSRLKLKTSKIPPALVYHTAVVIGRYMIIKGGNVQSIDAGECYTRDTFLFDLVCMEWTSAPGESRSIKFPVRHSHAATVYKGYMLIVGGFNGRPMNDILALYPPSEHCSHYSVSSRLKNSGKCKSPKPVHCVKCHGSCQELSTCPTQINKCSVCYRLTDCLECTLYSCEWCIEERSCRAKGSGDICGEIRPEPFWGKKGHLLTTPAQCQTQDMAPGLHYIKYIDPLNLDTPEDVSIVQTADVSLFYQKQASIQSEWDTSNLRKYRGILRGFINPYYRNISHNHPKSKQDGSLYQLQLIFKAGLIEFFMGHNENDKIIVFNTTRSRIAERNLKCSVPVYDMVYIEAVLIQYINNNQKVTNLTLMWNGGPIKYTKGQSPKYIGDEVLHQNVLVPNRNGTCTHHGTCLSCLTDQLCGWCPHHQAPSCQKRTVSCTDSTGLFLVTNPEKCDKCEELLSCQNCVLKPGCEWMKLNCYRRGRFKGAITSLNSCLNPCSKETDCLKCTKKTHCAWCKSLQKCYSMNTLIVLHPFGLCSEWVSYHNNPWAQDSYSPLCSSCEMLSTCSNCLSVQGCGWCAVRNSPHNGRCIHGNYEFGDCEDPSVSSPVDWHYTHCPLVDECALNLHNCHPNALCQDTPQYFNCTCKKGYTGDGVNSCKSTCDKRCEFGTCNNRNQCECSLGYTGINCDQDCGCNGHSTCSQGQGQCDECQHLTRGATCGECKEGAFRLLSNGRNVCNPCSCNDHHDPNRGYCDRNTGDCYCTDNTSGDRCQVCAKGFYGDARNNGVCYMVARSRVELSFATDGAIGNVQSVRQYRHSGSGYENVMWYINPPLSAVDIVVILDSFKSWNTDLPGSLYIWEGLPPHIGGKEQTKNSRMLLSLSPYILSQPDLTAVSVLGSGTITILYEGMLSTKFNVSYHLRNCTHNCNTQNDRFNHTCNHGMKCQCAAGYMGPHCSVQICPDNCSNQGTCVTNTGICKCDSSNSGISCNKRSTAHIKWTTRSYDWAPPTQRIMEPRMGHSAVTLRVQDRGVIVIFGGYDIHNIFSDTWIFDTDTQSWSYLDTSSSVSRPSPRYLHSTVTVRDDKFCIVGGQTESGLTNEVWCLELSIDNATSLRHGVWTNQNSIGLHVVAGSGLVRYTHDTWYLLGGMSNTGPTNKLYQYTRGDNVWTLVQGTRGIVAPMYGHTMTVYKDTLYVICDSGLYKYLIATKTWVSYQPTSDDDMTLFRSRYHAVTEHDGVLYLIGGKHLTPTHQSKLNQDLYAIRLETGTHVQLTYEDSKPGSMILSQLTIYEHKLYLVGGYNGSVHSMIQSYDLLDSICFMIQDEGDCHKFGCAWCNSQLKYHNLCILTALPGCTTQLPRTHTNYENCGSVTDCISCSLLPGCFWSKTCLTQTDPTTKTSVCSADPMCRSNQNCTACMSLMTCTWYKDSCVATRDVSRGVTLRDRKCQIKCADVTDCVHCTVSKGCQWSKGLETCLDIAYIDWFCLFNRCDMLVSPVQCPEPCSQHTSCAVCKEHDNCGWCNNPTFGNTDVTASGFCSSGNVNGPHDIGKCNSVSSNWFYFKCPPENECSPELDIHTCRADQECVDLDDGYECKCHNGTTEAHYLEMCIPSCERYGCVHGRCNEIDNCTCNFGYYGRDCSKKCDCSGHSECDEQGKCVLCLNNTIGENCEMCLPNYVRNVTECVPCYEVCHRSTRQCIERSHFGSTPPLIGPRSIADTKCVNCANNAVGELCETCRGGFFRDSVSGKCELCRCNFHAVVCDKDTGLDCQCENNTKSSYKYISSKSNKCTKDDFCSRRQCDICEDGYHGHPVNGSMCYEALTELAKNYEVEFNEDHVAKLLHVKSLGYEDMWIYIKMENVSGSVYATLNPSMFTIQTSQHRGHAIRYQRSFSEYKIRPYTSPWITGVGYLDWNSSDKVVTVLNLNNERKFIKYTPSPIGTPEDIYIVLYVHNRTDTGRVFISWYQSSDRFNYYLCIDDSICGTILVGLMSYCFKKLVSFIITLILQHRQNNQAKITREKLPFVKISIDVSETDEFISCFKTTAKNRYCGIYEPVPQTTLPKIRPVAVQEVKYLETRCGLGTLFIKLPGPPGNRQLMLGSTLFEIKPDTMELVRRYSDQLIRETAI